jgi:hypothetical protein
MTFAAKTGKYLLNTGPDYILFTPHGIAYKK